MSADIGGRARQKAAKLWKLLPRGKAKRGRRKRRETDSPISDRRSIHERPDNVQTRQKTGDWEADLMICKRTRPVLVLHERRSRLTIASKLTGKSAAETVTVMMSIFKRLSPELKNSITFDKPQPAGSGSNPARTEVRRPRRGGEFARHGLLASVTGMSTWFCDAYVNPSWPSGHAAFSDRIKGHLAFDG